MGYTHYWHRPGEHFRRTLSKYSADFEALILPRSDEGVERAAWNGTGAPEISNEAIRFNGRTGGHAANEEIIIFLPL